MTQGINHQIDENLEFGRFVLKCLERHKKGNWGNCSKEDIETNEAALKSGDRLFSVYKIPKTLKMRKDKIWIITEANRSATTVLFPSEY